MIIHHKPKSDKGSFILDLPIHSDSHSCLMITYADVTECYLYLLPDPLPRCPKIFAHVGYFFWTNGRIANIIVCRLCNTRYRNGTIIPSEPTVIIICFSNIRLRKLSILKGPFLLSSWWQFSLSSNTMPEFVPKISIKNTMFKDTPSCWKMRTWTLAADCSLFNETR
jgi:hypothetical protein